MAQYECCGLLGRELAQGTDQVGSLGDGRGVSRRGGPAETADDLARLTNALMPSV
jgi:hypothetical protein